MIYSVFAEHSDFERYAVLDECFVFNELVRAVRRFDEVAVDKVESLSVVRFARRDKLVSALLEHACRAVSYAEMIFRVCNLLDFAVGQADKVFCKPLFSVPSL